MASLRNAARLLPKSSATPARSTSASTSRVVPAAATSRGVATSAGRCSVRRIPDASSLTPSMTLSSVRAFSCSSSARQEEGAPQPERELDDGEKNIISILKKEYQPELLQVQDVSGGCGSFYSIVVASHRFKGVPTIKAHRMINESLKEVISGIHGLQLRTMPADDAKFD